MRLRGVPWSLVCLLAAPGTTALPLLAEHPDPNQILRAIHESLGGEKRLAGVTSIEFELTVALATAA